MPPTAAAAAAAASSSSTASAATATSSTAAATAKRGAAAAAAANNNNVNSTGVLDYLQKSLPRDALLELYQDETRGKYVCRSVVQHLSGVAQQVVLRLQCTGGTFPLTGLSIWMKGGTASTSSTNSKTKSKPERVLAELYKWALIVEYDEQGRQSSMIQLTPQFKTGFEASLCSLDGAPWPAVTPDQILAIERAEKVTQHVAEVTPEDLERYTQSQWDAVLHFLVGSTGHQEPSPAVVNFLLKTELMQPDPDDRGGNEGDADLVITDKGYEFMLQDNHRQVWHFVLQYLKTMENQRTPEKAKKLRKEALLLLICLSFARVGDAYLISSLTKKAGAMVKDLALFGILYTSQIGSQTLFYPTRVAMQLVESNDKNDQAAGLFSLSSKALEESLAHPRPHDSSHLAIIVQTNFQLCAYTTSELHISMLGLFCDLHTIRRLPNMVFMHITRDSVRSAFALGIKARQILRFLEKHAHPNLRTQNVLPGSGSSPVPGNVIDQIWLWDRERGRVRFTKVYQHQVSELDPVAEFRAVQQYAKDLGALAWSSDTAARLLYIDYKYAERVNTFARNWRRRAAQQHG